MTGCLPSDEKKMKKMIARRALVVAQGGGPGDTQGSIGYFRICWRRSNTNSFASVGLRTPLEYPARGGEAKRHGDHNGRPRLPTLLRTPMVIDIGEIRLIRGAGSRDGDLATPAREKLGFTHPGPDPQIFRRCLHAGPLAYAGADKSKDPVSLLDARPCRKDKSQT
eukprot:Skav236521  [mRNA]  locus=scaffold78:947913:948410:- [translate_table: standard]